eukprot:380476_1
MALFTNMFKKKKKKSDESAPKKSIALLVIRGGESGQNFYKLFEKCKLKNGTGVKVEQASWRDIQLTSYSDNIKPIVSLKPSLKPLPNTPQNRVRSIQPDFLLVRELARGVKVSLDHRNLLYGFMISQTPSINSLHSMYCMNERALMTGELIRLNRKFGQEKFPIFTQYYYPMHEEMLITPQYPIVLKIGHAHAGFGKIKLDNHKQFGDMKSIVATTTQYCTAENYIEGKCDLRLQKIGDNYQAYKRVNMSGNWKTNTGTAMIEHIKVLPRYKFWMDECSKAFGGGFEICTVDVLVENCDDENEYILEFNGTASGFGDTDGDNVILRDYVMKKLNEYFVDGDKGLNEPKYMNNDDIVRDIKDEQKYDETKYEKKMDENENDNDNEEVNENVEDKDKLNEEKPVEKEVNKDDDDVETDKKPDEVVSND